jgi:ferredoxin-thioredoxin reductase catalytic chain
MDTRQLYKTLQKLQEPKGYYFNRDEAMTLGLLDGLLRNKEHFGYMACPCRLAGGNYDQDKDIICPCVYRVPDVEEYGSCYCGLYVSKEWNEGRIEHAYVPERRPAEKTLATLDMADDDQE